MSKLQPISNDIKLYDEIVAFSPQVARLAFAEKGLVNGRDFELVSLDLLVEKEQYQPWYLKLNPNGVLPTMVLAPSRFDTKDSKGSNEVRLTDDGEEIVTDCLVISHRIDKMFPNGDQTLFPTNKDDLKLVNEWVHRWDNWGGKENTVAPAFQEGFKRKNTLADLKHRKRILTSLKSKEPDHAEKYQKKIDGIVTKLDSLEDEDAKLQLRQTLTKEIKEFLQMLEDNLSNSSYDELFIVPSHGYSMADVVWTCLLSRLEMAELGHIIAEYPTVTRYYDQMQVRPSYTTANICKSVPGSVITRVLCAKVQPFLPCLIATLMLIIAIPIILVYTLD